jgi:hypothetical protein
MKAIVAPQPDGAEELAVVERPVPRVGPGEVLVQVAAAGVNRPDILQRRGLYPPPPGAPDVLGLEIAGTVVEADGGSGTLIGKKVCALVAGGGYAQYCVAPAGTCFVVPEVLSLAEAAAMPEQVHDDLKRERIEKLVEVVQRVAAERNAGRVGMVEEVLVEGPSRTEPELLRGRTRRNTTVNFSGDAGPGELVSVAIASATSTTLAGAQLALAAA